MVGKSFVKLLMLGVIVFYGITGCNNNNTNTDIDNNRDIVQDDIGKTINYLFVQNGTSGTFIANGDGNYTLSINGIASQTIYFSDRPVRKTGQVEMQKFLDTMCFGSSNPPNAAIEIMNGTEDSDVIIVELFDPIYNNNAATLQYTAHILKDANHSIASFNERNDVSIPTSFESVALFIDDCSDITVDCGIVIGRADDYSGNLIYKTAGQVTCCQCWSWGECDFYHDCCSFERCQNKCKSKYGEKAKWIRNPDTFWNRVTASTNYVDNSYDWDQLDN